jgi:hypothetical protein
LKSNGPVQVPAPAVPQIAPSHDPHESLIADARAGLSPRQVVEGKLLALLHAGVTGRKRKGE